ncbi:hypothetical protein DM02DRAFT_649655 [Periconia macrospinosa]|uniref:Uncharacterized protein n=1 Tax=Periconia macrospinosa TaxID=97972 RepID=A0A2V1E7I2_9PLEO|nr:hypothetical protein DM02DRAFT_649655 [Periconia macrospinosa]
MAIAALSHVLALCMWLLIPNVPAVCATAQAPTQLPAPFNPSASSPISAITPTTTVGGPLGSSVPPGAVVPPIQTRSLTLTSVTPLYPVPTVHSEIEESSFEATGPSTSSVIHTERTATGFETGRTPPGLNDARPQETRPPVAGSNPQADPVTIPSVPSVVGIETNIYSTVVPNRPGNAPPPVDAQPTKSGLLVDIISNLVPPQGLTTRPNAGVTQPANFQAEQQPTVAIGGLITLGPSATLTLTPGLSTTVGAGSAATQIAITTDNAGKTFIVLSSSGTAVTATVTKTLTTSTLPETGFGGSPTVAARPASSNTKSPTPDEGGAMGRALPAWYPNVFFGILGLGVAF